VRQGEANPPAEPAQQQVVDVRLVTWQEDKRLFFGSGGDGHLAELSSTRSERERSRSVQGRSESSCVDFDDAR
jgi:hypothetical protein